VSTHFAIRSAIQATGSDLDAAMARVVLGPFSDKETARQALATYLTDRLTTSARARTGSVGALFLAQYTLLVAAMAAGTGDVIEADGIRWTIS
jgi:hypothetical protein